MLTDDMHDLVQRFYSWERTNNPADIGYPHIDPVRRLSGGTVGSLGLTDDEALYIDKALCNLKAERPDEYAVLARVYRDGKTLRWMERRGEGNRKTNALRLSNARGYLRGWLACSTVVAN